MHVVASGCVYEGHTAPFHQRSCAFTTVCLMVGGVVSAIHLMDTPASSPVSTAEVVGSCGMMAMDEVIGRALGARLRVWPVQNWYLVS